MKKVILCLAAVFCVAISANAQDAGQLWVGGTVGFGVDSPDVGDSETEFVIRPEVGYQLNDKWGVGISLGYGQDANDFQSFSVNPFARFSFLEGGIGNLFLEGGIEFENFGIKGQDKENMLGIGIRPGVNVNISDNLSLIGKFGFLGWRTYTESKLNQFGIMVDPAQDLQIGLIFKF